MNQDSQLKNRTLKELEFIRGLCTGFLILSSIFILIVGGRFIYSIIILKNGNYSYYTPLAIFAVINFLCFYNLKKVKAEIKSRNS
jgi:hypothetical protein